MAKMTQTQIIAEMSAKSGISKKQTKDFMAALIELAQFWILSDGHPGTLNQLVAQPAVAGAADRPVTTKA